VNIDNGNVNEYETFAKMNMALLYEIWYAPSLNNCFGEYNANEMDIQPRYHSKMIHVYYWLK